MAALSLSEWPRLRVALEQRTEPMRVERLNKARASSEKQDARTKDGACKELLGD